MAQRIEAPLAVELAGVFALENRIIEHLRRADEIDAVLSDILLAARFLPLKHDAPSTARPEQERDCSYLAAGLLAGKRDCCAHCPA